MLTLHIMATCRLHFKHQKAFSLPPFGVLLARCPVVPLGKGGRVSLGDVTAHARLQV